jgi:hypothetical protein
MEYQNLLPAQLRDSELFKGLIDLLEYLDQLENTQVSKPLPYGVELIMQIFPDYRSVEAVEAYYNVGINPLIGTWSAFKTAVKLASLEAEVIEWWEDSSLPMWGVFFRVAGPTVEVRGVKSLIDLLYLVKSERTILVGIGVDIPQALTLDSESSIELAKSDTNKYESHVGATYRGVPLSLCSPLPTIMIDVAP